MLTSVSCTYCPAHAGWSFSAPSVEQAVAMRKQHIREQHPEVGMMLDLIDRLDKIMPLLESLSADYA